MQHPWRLPWLSNRAKQGQLSGILVLIDFVAVIGSNSISKQGFRVLIFGEHPEDLGRVVREEDGAVLHPASIWQLEELRDLLKIMELDSSRPSSTNAAGVQTTESPPE